jgi:hypothetical protein
LYFSAKIFSVSIVAHAVFYLFASFREVMPWSSCSHKWNTPLCSERMRVESMGNRTDERVYASEYHRLHPFNQTSLNNSILPQRVSSADEYYHIYMLGINHSKGLSDLGPIKVDLLLCLISIFVLMYVCIRHGVKSTGKALRRIHSEDL